MVLMITFAKNKYDKNWLNSNFLFICLLQMTLYFLLNAITQ